MWIMLSGEKKKVSQNWKPQTEWPVNQDLFDLAGEKETGRFEVVLPAGQPLCVVLMLAREIRRTTPVRRIGV